MRSAVSQQQWEATSRSIDLHVAVPGGSGPAARHAAHRHGAQRAILDLHLQVQLVINQPALVQSCTSDVPDLSISDSAAVPL